MNELKTLKDLGTKAMKVESPYQMHYITGEELRQEAIKWIKTLKGFYDLEYNERDRIGTLFFGTRKPETHEIMIAIRTIKHLFNITEEELK